MRWRLLHAVPLLIAGIVVPAQAETALFDSAPLNEAELAQERGGFELPGGIQVALSIRIATDVDGNRLLETVWRAEGATVSAVSQAAGGDPTALDPRGAVAKAELPGLVVEDFVGERVSTIIANTADGRTIDHHVQVDLSLSGVQQLGIGSAIFRTQSPGIEASILRAVGS